MFGRILTFAIFKFAENRVAQLLIERESARIGRIQPGAVTALALAKRFSGVRAPPTRSRYTASHRQSSR